MPLRVDENPSPYLLHPAELPLSNQRDGYQWCAVQTLSQREKTLAHWLTHREMHYFLPVLTYRDASRRAVLKPMFPGIIFLALSVNRFFESGAHPELDEARDSRCIYGYLHTKNQSRLRSELVALASDTVRPEPLLYDANYERGQRVRVHSGPLKGLVGFFLKWRSDPNHSDQTGPGGPAFSPEDAAPNEANPRMFIETQFVGIASLEVDASVIEKI